jgi:thiol-disulfide isomerase/thioredoxin
MVEPIARTVQRITVTEADAINGELTLPEIEAHVLRIASIGDTPSLDFVRTNGTGGPFADLCGKPTVVHFWASWCGPCKQQLPELKKLHDEFSAGQGLEIVSVSMDDDPDAWKSELRSVNMPWTQVRATSRETTGVSSVPIYWFVDTTGKIVAKAKDPSELAQQLRDILNPK